MINVFWFTPLKIQSETIFLSGHATMQGVSNFALQRIVKSRAFFAR